MRETNPLRSRSFARTDRVRNRHRGRDGPAQTAAAGAKTDTANEENLELGLAKPWLKPGADFFA